MGVSNLTARYYTLADYDTVAGWWKAHNEGFPPQEFLPGTGIVMEVEGKPVCAGFLYRTDSKICIFEWQACDPKAGKKERNVALDGLVDTAIWWAKENGFGMIHSSTNIQRFTKRLKDKGFIGKDRNYTNLFMKV